MPERSDLLHVPGGGVDDVVHGAGQRLGVPGVHELRWSGLRVAGEPVAAARVGDPVGVAAGAGLRIAGGL